VLVLDPGGLATASTYDEAGNLKTRTDARGITATYGYDLLNRVTTVSYPDSSRNLVFEYDLSSTECNDGERFGKGRVTMMTDSSGTTVTVISDASCSSRRAAPTCCVLRTPIRAAACRDGTIWCRTRRLAISSSA
jgi:YD repeat-containing protein